MAIRTWTGLAGDGLWASVGNWDGGASIPATTDDVVFNGTGVANMTNMGANRTVLSIDFTGYTGTFTFTHFIIPSGGNVTLGAGMGIAGTSGISVAITGGTFTANGKTIPLLSISGASTHTLADAWVCSGLVTLGASGTTTINGGSITCQAGLTIGGTTSIVSGTTTLTLAGTGTWAGPTTTGSLRLTTTINTAGTITLSGNVGFAGTITYVAGTVVTTGSTLSLGAAAATVDMSPITFNNITLTGSVTHTLTSALTCTGLLTIGLTTAAVVINGQSINTSGGLRFGGTSGSCSGTTVINCNGTQSIDCPSRTTGRLLIPMNLNAPNGTITVSSGCDMLLGDFMVQPGTVVVTAADTRMKVCGAVAG